MIAIILSLYVQVLSFPGGSAEKLADFVFETAGSKIFVIASEAWNLPAAAIDEKDPKKRWVALAKKLGLEAGNQGVPHHMGFRSLPMFQSTGSLRLDSKYFQEWKQTLQFLEKDDRKGNKRYLRATIALKDLAKLGFEKSLWVHWVLKDYFVVVRAEGVSSREILSAIADAVGG